MMTVTVMRRGASVAPGTAALRVGPIGVALLVALPLALALSWGEALHVWQTGDFANTDDATRAVQIRDWLAGQGWFDLTAHRMGLPAGLLSHWSRVVDVPVAGLVRFFDLFLPPDLAERAARIAFPLGLQGLLVAAMAAAARVLAGPRAVVPAALVIVTGLVGLSQFAPGRIHHHAPQIALLTLAVAVTLDALGPGRARRAAWAGAVMALSIAVGLENLPFFVVLLCAVPIAWVVGGPAHARALLWLSAGFGVASAALFAALVPPARYGITTPDAFSLAQLVAIEGGCVLLAVAGLSTPHLTTRRSRLAILAGGAAALGTALVLLFPEALHGPYAHIDALLHAFWLDDVAEAQPFPRFVATSPGATLIMVGPMVVGAAASVVAAWRSAGLARGRWLVVLALVGVGALGSLWGIRVLFSLQPVALLGGAWALAGAWREAERDGRLAALWRPAALLCLLSSLAWAMGPWPAAPDASPSRPCFAARAAAPLAALGTGLVFAPIDSGPFLLAHTGLSVLAGPYHRDIAGLHAVIAGFLAPPEEARGAILATGARYLAVCGAQTSLEAKAAPDGLAAALARGDIPPWLVPVDLGPTPFRVFALR